MLKRKTTETTQTAMITDSKTITAKKSRTVTPTTISKPRTSATMTRTNQPTSVGDSSAKQGKLAGEAFHFSGLTQYGSGDAESA
jgi:hypothetical protein